MAMYRDNPLKNVPWDKFQKLGPEEKGPYFLRHGRPYHALVAQQFDRPTLDRLCEMASRIRRIAKTRGGLLFLQDLLSEKRAMLYFAQPSTRTFLSFYAACQILGMHPAEVRDTATSSELKGESPEDSVRTFSSYFDLIIMRHSVGGFAERIAWILSNTERPVPVVNAGSGKDQHPTQALLDIYTLQRSFEKIGGIEGKKIAFVGDLARGRTVRSLAWLLTLYPGVKQYFVAPELAPDRQGHPRPAATRRAWSTRLRRLREDHPGSGRDLHDAHPGRVGHGARKPSDRHEPVSASRRRTWRRLKQTAVLMHPLPRRKEIDPAVDSDPRAVYWRQVRNGMWIRAALILTIFERDERGGSVLSGPDELMTNDDKQPLGLWIFAIHSSFGFRH